MVAQYSELAGSPKFKASEMMFPTSETILVPA